jgi:hopanoid biosynthesis associated RND transporter like protein HpnN
MANFGESILRTCATVASRRPWFVLLVALAITVAAGYAGSKLSINTSTDDVLSADLPFRQVDLAYRTAFPEEDLAVVVIDAPTPEGAQEAAETLVERLEGHPNLFERVELAGDSPYFDRYGWLFLTPERIAELGAELRQARRLLINLSRDPTLRGMASLLSMAQQGMAEGGDPSDLASLVTRVAETAEKRAEGQPANMPWQAIFSAGDDGQGARRLVQILPVLDNSSIDRAGPALEGLDTAMAAVLADRPGVTMRVTGDPVLRQQELNDAFSGAIYASGFSFVLVALSLILGIRSGRLIAALLITLVVGSIWTTGLAAVSIGRLNLISVAFLVLFFGLGVDFGTHLGLRHLEEARRGVPFPEALKRAMLGEAPGIGLSALCAALAFLAFVPTTYVGLAEFGIISALGMVVAVAVTFTVQPALMAVMPPKPKIGSSVTFPIGDWIRRFYRGILVVAALVSIAAAFAAVSARLDVNPLNLQNPNTEPVQTYRDLANDPETSPYALNVLAPDVEAARALQAQLAALPGVEGVRWIGDFVPEDQPARLAAIAAVRERMGEAFFQEQAGEPPPTDAALADAFAKLRDTAAAIAADPTDAALSGAGARLAAALDRFAQTRGTEPAALTELGTALTGEMPGLVANLRQQLSVTQPVSFEDIPPELSRDWVGANGEIRLRVLPAGDISSQADLQSFAERVQAVAPAAAGVPATITGAGDAILEAFVEAIAYTVIAIGLVIALMRRRLSDVLLVLAPLAIAALWTVAASAILNLPFNFANVIVIPLLIGLGVASSVHIVIRSHEVVNDSTGTHEEGTDVLETSTPLAVLVAQLNTVAAFATLAVSHHRGLYSMGLLLGISILFVLIASLVVLPAFLMAMDNRGKTPPSHPAPA